ncbi:hypothetical protein MPER_01272, partial [Moniliophthora perniciosa FA553]
HDSPYSVSAAPGRQVPSINSSIAEKYSLSADPKEWGTSLSPSFPEPDDKLHNPDPVRDRKNDQGNSSFHPKRFHEPGLHDGSHFWGSSSFCIALYPIYFAVQEPRSS